MTISATFITNVSTYMLSLSHTGDSIYILTAVMQLKILSIYNTHKSQKVQIIMTTKYINEVITFLGQVQWNDHRYVSNDADTGERKKSRRS